MPSSRQIAFDRSRLLATLLEAAQAREQIRAAEQSVRLERGQAVVAGPGELLLHEHEHLVDRRPPKSIDPPTSFHESI